MLRGAGVALARMANWCHVGGWGWRQWRADTAGSTSGPVPMPLRSGGRYLRGLGGRVCLRLWDD